MPIRESTCHVTFGPGETNWWRALNFMFLSPRFFVGEGPSVHRLLPNWTTHFPVHVLLVFHTDGRFHCSQLSSSSSTFMTEHRIVPLSFAILNADRNGMAGLLAQVARDKTFDNTFGFSIFKVFFWIVNYFRVFWKANCRSNKFLSVCNVFFGCDGNFNNAWAKIAIWNSFYGFAKYSRIVEKVVCGSTNFLTIWFVIVF